MMKEFNKINNLTQREAAEFLAENNLEIDEEIYNYLKQMTLSQIHFDENIQLLTRYYTQTDHIMIGNHLFVKEDGTIQKMTASKAREYDRQFFFAIMEDIKQMNFEKFNDLLKFILKYEDSNFRFTEEEIQYFQQYGNGDEKIGFRRLEKEVQEYRDILSDIDWYNIEQNRIQKEKLTSQLEENKKKLEEIKGTLRGIGQPIISKIQSKFVEKDKRKSLKVEQKTKQLKIKSLDLELKELEEKRKQLTNNYKSPETIQKELLEKLEICEHLSENKLNRKRIEELRTILIKDPDLEKNILLLMTRYNKITSNFGRKYSGFSQAVTKLFADIDSQLKMNIGIFSEKNLKSEDLLSLINNIRKQMIDNRIVSDHSIVTEYRTQSLGKSKYITGTNLNNEQITEAMIQLNKEFEKLKHINDTEIYIRGCADIFQQFLMIHPFMDGNGRTSRIMLTVMLAQRNIFIPSVYSSYTERDPDSMFMVFGDEAATKGNFKLFEDYILAWVQKYNPNVVEGNYTYLTEAYQKLLMEKYNSESLEDAIPKKINR